ncbi:FAD-dependent oxidoreductase [Rhodopseudomonas palustris]|uniref:NAD(P)/FAD-dependent oxidoreductase n=1 Tax=Rhodopseudomonas palustris TaxID=1076 RepID=UPI002ACDDB27|nr:FAD-dependent oxidoreductase [Rhodopseudomonas palustris]WQH00545.1 FAD-dependent oxidoreductase [Rhodopseudomonas palustris]
MDLLESRIVIVGAGQAGARAAEALRAAGHRGSVTLIGDESHPPYERPQLSKKMLIDQQAAATLIRPAQEWSDLGITLRTGSRAETIDLDRRRLGLCDGGELDFDRLLIATGTRPRRLAALETAPVPVHYLRGIDDALTLRRRLVAGAQIVLIGGGVIGLEVAAAALLCGCNVTILERSDRLLPQIGSNALSLFAHEMFALRGATILCNVELGAMHQAGLTLADGRVVPADVIVVGIGVAPAGELAGQIGLAVDQGIRVDASGATERDGIYAAGDVAEQWSCWHGRWTRFENWANAQNQAIATARAMAGLDSRYEAPPWFWSDQFDTNIQVVGHPGGAEEIVRGDPATSRFSAISVQNGEVVGAISVNSAKDMAMLRRIVASRKTVDPGALANPAFDLKRALA